LRLRYKKMAANTRSATPAIGTTTAMAIFALLLRPPEAPSPVLLIVGGAVLVVAGVVAPGWLTVGVRVTTTTSVLVLSSGSGASFVGVEDGGVVGVVFDVGGGLVELGGDVSGGGVDVDEGGGEVDVVSTGGVPGLSAPAVGSEASLAGGSCGGKFVLDEDIVLFWNLVKVANCLRKRVILAMVPQQQMPW
jgi:hypothetical protein